MATNDTINLTAAQNARDYKAAKGLFERVRKYAQFQIGDILLERWRWDEKSEWRYTEVQNKSGILYRFKVVGRDEYGMTYVSRINAGGKLGVAFCLETYKPQYEYLIDERQVDAILLNGQYDPKADMRKITKAKEEIRKYNKSISFCATSNQELMEWFEKNVAVGNRIWYTYMRTYTTSEWWSGEVTSITKNKKKVWHAGFGTQSEPNIEVETVNPTGPYPRQTLMTMDTWNYYRFSLVPPKFLTKEIL